MLRETSSLRPTQKIALGLLILPVISSVLALQTHAFLFKSAVAGSCIVILLVAFWGSLSSSKGIWWIVGAFVFSIGGDWFLSHKADSVPMFVSGIGLFFLAHGGYLGYALINGRIHRSATAILMIGYLAFFFTQLLPSIRSPLLVCAVLLYLLISCFSLGAAAGLNSPKLSQYIYLFGISLILFSDTLIAFHEFTEYQNLNILILPTYYLAQIAITLSVLLRDVSRSSGGADPSSHGSNS